MADYWKSIPKKYCEFCKCWITDNKASKDFHERGLRHQANVRRKVKEIQKNSTIVERERQEYQNALLKIESAALKSFKNDVTRDPSLVSEYSTTKTISSQIIRSELIPNKRISTNRFGESSDNYNDSDTLNNTRKRALETIAKSFEKKSKWLEAKSSDGKIYYWNKDTYETQHTPPKNGYLSISEQEQLRNVSNSGGDSNISAPPEVYRVDPYGGWKNVEKYDTNKMVDLQLPDQDVSQIVLEIEQNKVTEQEMAEANKNNLPEFKEKTVESMNKRLASKDETVTFKKRIKTQRNIRNKVDND